MAEIQYIGKGGLTPTERKARQKQRSLDQEFTEERTRAVAVKRQQTEMLLAKARGELIVKQLVERQAAYLLVALRQRIMSMPSTYARRMVNLPDTKAAAAVLKEVAISVLNEIKDLPSRVTDPNWLETLEGDESRPG
jgi:hypothetical protein